MAVEDFARRRILAFIEKWTRNLRVCAKDFQPKVFKYGKFGKSLLPTQ
jgi:hypothetical protein